MTSVRFSHYCLDDGDEYFGDVIAEYRAVRLTLGNNNNNNNTNSLAQTYSDSLASSSGTISSPPHNSGANNTLLLSPSNSTKLATGGESTILQLMARRFTDANTNNNNSNNSPARSGTAATTHQNLPTILNIEQFQSSVRGRLRFAGKGVFFDADDSGVPVVGFRASSILSSWEQLRKNAGGGGGSGLESLWASPVLPLSSCSEWLGKDVAERLCRSGGSSNSSELLSRTIVFPFSGSIFGQRRFGLPHPHIVDSAAFPASSWATTTIHLQCFVLPYANNSSDHLSRVNMLLLVSAKSLLSSSSLSSPSSSSSSTSSSAASKLLMIQQARESTNKFKLSYLQDPDTEDILREVCCHRIQPLVRERGRVVITSTSLYFQPTFPIASSFSSSSSSGTSSSSDADAANIMRLSLSSVVQVERRWFGFAETALEIFYESADNNSSSNNTTSSIFLHFETLEQRELFGAALRKHQIVRPILRAASVTHVQELWHQGRVSNFDYLMFLNSFAGRSRQDLSQYPVLPWVLANFSTDQQHQQQQILDLTDPRNYRDLSKPVGALNKSRLDMFKSRAKELKEMGEPAFLFGTHYSNPAYVVYFLLRSAPQLMLVLQSGRWDKPGRLFDSVPGVWNSVNEAPTDVKELIPEFFEGTGDFLDLRQTLQKAAGSGSIDSAELESLFDFGKKDDGTPVRFAVELPAWAQGSVANFVKLHRQALESHIVSEALHKWIDLIFGYKQRGEEAWKADNVFHPSCYEDDELLFGGAAAGGRVMDEEEIASRTAHRQLFGMVPRQIFTEPHPQRRCTTMAGMAAMQHADAGDDKQQKPKLVSLREALLEISQSEDLMSPQQRQQRSEMRQRQQQSNGGGNNNTDSFAGSSREPSLANSFTTMTAAQQEQQQRQHADALAEALEHANSSSAAVAVPEVEAAPEFFKGFDSPVANNSNNRAEEAQAAATAHAESNTKNTGKKKNHEDDDELPASENFRGTGDIMIQCLVRATVSSSAAAASDTNKNDNNVSNTFISKLAAGSSVLVVTSSGCIASLNRDGTEVTVVPVGSRGIDTASAASVVLPEKCIAMLPWSETQEGAGGIQQRTSSSSSNNLSGQHQHSWIILISHCGTVLTLSAEKCRVYSRVPDTSNDSIITACGLWRGNRLVFCGRNDGSVATWSISAPQDPDSPPVLSKSSVEVPRFESGRPALISARESSRVSSARVVFASDDGESLLIGPPPPAASSASAVVKVVEFAGFPQDVEMKIISHIWPIDIARAATTSESLRSMPLGGGSSEQIAVGALLNDGRLLLLACGADSDSTDMFDVVESVSIGTNNSGNNKVASSCLLNVPASNKLRAVAASSSSSSSSSCFLLAAVGSGIAVLDADTTRVVTFLEGASAGAPVTHVAAGWPFVVALDAAGSLKVWELLMF